MTESSYTTFTLNNLLYGIDTIFVEEIFYLPEITIIPETPKDIIGVINIRGNIVPIMDLNYRFGYQTSSDYQLTDSVIILKWLNFRVGILVNQVHEVRTIFDKDITQESSYSSTIISQQEEKFSKGVAQNVNDMIILLNLEKMLVYVEEQDINLASESLEDINDKNNIVSLKIPQFCPHASSEERKIFKNRASDLKKVIGGESKNNLTSIALIELQNELLGVDLNIVKEFIKIRKITPIPCTPNYVVGNMNLRGEILTLIDISKFLNLSPIEINNDISIMVIEIEQMVLGILINSFVEILSFDPGKILESSEETENYFQGILPYEDNMISLLDLLELLKAKDLVNDYQKV